MDVLMMAAAARHALAACTSALLVAVASATYGPVPSAAAASDPLRNDQYNLDQARFEQAWKTSTGAAITIAIVDTGVDLKHPDLVSQLVTGVDLVDGGKPQDENGHGTHVAGIAAATQGNGIGIAGAAPQAQIMPIRVLDAAGSGDPAVIAQGILWAVDNGATVINLSLGGSGLSARLLKGGEINRAIRVASSRGAVVVAAAGNDGQVRRAYRFGVPVIVVNAVDAQGELSAFSNYADARAVSAAGSDILSTLPRYPTADFPEGTNGYGTLSGTSMAAPLVAGEVALLLAQGRTSSEVIDVVSTTANPTNDPRLGAGIIDAKAAVKVDAPKPETEQSDRLTVQNARPDLRVRQQKIGDRPELIAAIVIGTLGLATVMITLASFWVRRRRHGG
jgi:subtilisin family serine protease